MSGDVGYNQISSGGTCTRALVHTRSNRIIFCQLLINESKLKFKFTSILWCFESRATFLIFWRCRIGCTFFLIPSILHRISLNNHFYSQKIHCFSFIKTNSVQFRLYSLFFNRLLFHIELFKKHSITPKRIDWNWIGNLCSKNIKILIDLWHVSSNSLSFSHCFSLRLIFISQFFMNSVIKSCNVSILNGWNHTSSEIPCLCVLYFLLSKLWAKNTHTHTHPKIRRMKR